MDGSRSWPVVALIFCALCLLSCNQGTSQQAAVSPESAVESQPLDTPSAGVGTFASLSASETGLDFVNKADSREILVSLRNFWGGVASADYDNDGDLDLYLANVEAGNKLFRNDGGWKFTDVTADSGAGLDCGELWSSGVYFVDIDADQDKDIYVCNMNGPNALFINDGAGKFKESAAASGLDSSYFSICAAFFDADIDGDLDVYLGNYLYDRFTDERIEAYKRMDEMRWDDKFGVATAPPELAGKVYKFVNGVIYPRPDPAQLLINDGKGKFSDQAEAAGVLNYGWTLAALASDFNNDALPDLYVSGDYETPDFYYINNGDGTFTDKAREMLRRTSFFSMGTDAGDINADGEMDFFVGDMLPGDYKDARKQSGDMYNFRWELINLHPQQNMRNTLFINRGRGWMTEMAEHCGLHASEWTWTVRIADLDCSGLPEVFCTNGYINRGIEVDYDNQVTKMRKEGRPREEIDELLLSLPPYLTDDRIFTCSKPLSYSAAPDNWGIHDNAIGCGASVADYDGDGDQDIIVNTTNGPLAAYRNDVAQSGRAVLHLRDPGSKSNPFAVGARVWAHFGGMVQAHDVILGRGFASGEEGDIYIGLGEADKIEKLEIRWPDGSLQTHENLAAGMRHSISKAGKLPLWQPAVPAPLFRQAAVDWEQKEVFTLEEEMATEPLLPVLQTTLGTGAGVADINADGNLDVYFCGPAGQPGQLMLGSADGKLKPAALPAGLPAADSEEMSALWFEANGDGRPDLLVTCGGSEAKPGSELYGCRLLLSSGEDFKPASLPERRLSTGSACAADVDNDGDLDLFLAGHLHYQSYGTHVPSAFWLNDGKGGFTDATAAIGPEVGKMGQVNEAQFADMTADGRPDLIVANKWGHIEVWPNEDGSFPHVLNASTWSGWWQSIGLGDFDGDGDLDIIAGNTGNNVKYHPKPDKDMPVTLYAYDFDKNGSRDLIEVKYRGDGCMLPGRGRSCSGYAIDYIPQKFPTWAAFADATLEDVYGPGLTTAERFDAQYLQSVYLRNDGEGKFSQSDLPGAAQFAPAFGIGVGDFNQDGKLDAFMANNYYATQPETGRWNSGYGVLMLGDGAGGFKPLEPGDSGILLPGDTRSVVAADFNNDLTLDLLVSASVGKPQLALRSSAEGASGLAVKLGGTQANPLGVGAYVSVMLDDGARVGSVVQAGSGYLASYSGPQLFSIPAGRSVSKVSVAWPDGHVSEVDKVSGTSVEVQHP